jgi:hypothetical protein
MAEISQILASPSSRQAQRSSNPSHTNTLNHFQDFASIKLPEDQMQMSIATRTPMSEANSLPSTLAATAQSQAAIRLS